jgi:hypothetical protein
MNATTSGTKTRSPASMSHATNEWMFMKTLPLIPGNNFPNEMNTAGMRKTHPKGPNSY